MEKSNTFLLKIGGLGFLGGGGVVLWGVWRLANVLVQRFLSLKGQIGQKTIGCIFIGNTHSSAY